MKKKLPSKKVGNHLRQIVVITFTFFISFLFLLNIIYEIKMNTKKSDISYGVSFSPLYSQQLGLDYKQVYQSLLDNLKIKNIRIPTYWPMVQPTKERFNFAEIDYMVNEASKRNAKILMVLGARQPRWPECHIPNWARKLTLEKRQQKTLEFTKKVVERYKGNNTIWGWQVENEPFLSTFGSGCDKPDKAFVQKEVELVKSIDNRPVILTDSGELNFWKNPMQLSDIFGTTMYRIVYNKFLGYTNYPYPPVYYALKSQIIRKFFAPNNQKTIITELQAEPWLEGNDPVATPIEKQIKIFSVKDFKSHVEFAQKTGFDEIYLWGVEWWYFTKEIKGHSQYWDYAKTIFIDKQLN